MTIPQSRRWLFLGVLVLFLVGVPLTIFILRQQQDTRSKAAASTILSFAPDSTATTPLSANIGDVIEFIIKIDPGTNIASILTFDLRYDATKLGLPSVDTTTNPPVTIDPVLNRYSFTEVPLYEQGRIRFTMEPSNVVYSIQEPTNVARVRLKALANTPQPTTLSFGSSTIILSVGPNDSGNENVLATANPAYLAINQAAVTPTTGPTATPQPSPTPLVCSPACTDIQLMLYLHAIGNAGDSADPNNATGSNKNPVTTNRSVNVSLYNPQNTTTPVLVRLGTVSYQSASSSGYFAGTLSIPQNELPAGDYVVKLKTNRYLQESVPSARNNVHTIAIGQQNTLPRTDLIVGDVVGDNKLDILDYNVLRDCGVSPANPLATREILDLSSVFNEAECQAHADRANTDLNDDARVDHVDINYFVRELSVQRGR